MHFRPCGISGTALRAPGNGAPVLRIRVTFPSTPRIPTLSPHSRRMRALERRMSEPAQHHAINYIEFTTSDIAGTKSFYETAFSWNFQDYGPDYIAFDRDHAGIDGGFRK